MRYSLHSFPWDFHERTPTISWQKLKSGWTIPAHEEIWTLQHYNSSLIGRAMSLPGCTKYRQNHGIIRLLEHYFLMDTCWNFKYSGEISSINGFFFTFWNCLDSIWYSHSKSSHTSKKHIKANSFWYANRIDKINMHTMLLCVSCYKKNMCLGLILHGESCF